jgi:hypothetical protein
MKRRRSILVTMAMVAWLALVLTASVALAQTNPSSVTVPYASRLTDETGQPLDGMYAFKFDLYDAETGGRLLWTETHAAVTVKNGDLALVLGEVQPLPKEMADHKAGWLAISVRGPQDTAFTLLNPRQRFNAPASPSALTCPHNHFTDSWPGTDGEFGLLLDNASTGDGLRAYSKSTVWNYAAVFGANTATTGYGTGVYGYSAKGAGMYANSAGGDGLEAYTTANSKSALYAHTTATGANGVWSISTSGIGVMGRSTTGDGVVGQSTGAGKSGVYGFNTITTSVGYGVFGRAQYGFGLGAEGNDVSYYDLLGDLVLNGDKGEVFTFGSILDLYTNNYVSIDLDNDNNNTNSDFAVLNGTDTPVFHVYENGNMTATGTKSAEVKTSRYGSRLLYAVESPEVWFEDIGTSILKDGAITIEFEPIFADTVDLTADYHVYVTPLCDEAVVLFVTIKTTKGFTVKGVTLDNRPSNCAFDYRVMAKRLGYRDVRLAPAETGYSKNQEVK